MTYRVDLEIYNGPLDLLLYLIRREEVEITDIPVVRITEQYLAYLELLESLDINIAGEFLVMAATLMELKSRILLPRPGELEEDELGEEEEDPRLALIQQLLEYKRFKDAADDLQGLGDEQGRRYSRPAAQIVIGPEEERVALDELMQGVELWDLLSAFARIMRSINLAPREVIYDDTPIEDLGNQIIDLIRERKTALFSELFLQVFAGYQEVTRSHLISAFLAVLECIRQRLIGIEQTADFQDLRVYWREERVDDVQSIQKAPPPPEAMITSREAAREADDFDRPEGRMKDDQFDTEELMATEFDDELEAIDVPEIAVHKPVYTDDELLGRPETDEAEEPSTNESDRPPEAPAAAEPPAEPAADEDDAGASDEEDGQR